MDVTEILRYALDDNTFIQHADKTTALKQGTVPITSRKPFSSTEASLSPHPFFCLEVSAARRGKKLSENFQKLSEKREKLSENPEKRKNFTKYFQKLYADGEIFFHRFFFAQLCNVGRT